MVLVVRVVVDSAVIEAPRLEQLLYDVVALFEVTLAVGARMVGARKACGELACVRRVVLPTAWPAVCRREVGVGRIPVESAVDRSATTDEASSEDSDIVAPPEGRVRIYTVSDVI